MICFVHIERAGGTTMHSIFRQNYPLGFLTLTPWHLWSNESDHELTAEEVKWLARLLPQTRGFGGHTTRCYVGYEEALGHAVQYVTFLREPIQRYKSHFHYQCATMKKDWTIDTFLAEKRFDNFQTRRIAGSDDVGLAKRYLDERFKFVGLTERFDESLVLLGQALGLTKFNTLYARENESRDPGYAEDPRLKEPELLERIRERNILDVELYDYVRREVYPRFVASFCGDLASATSQQQARRKYYRFPTSRRLVWQAHRHLVYRHIEGLLHGWIARRRRTFKEIRVDKGLIKGTGR